MPLSKVSPGGEQPGHFNLGECRALKKEVRSLASDPRRHRSRRVVILDSRVVVGAWAKGRSSSSRLNGIIRSCIGLLCVAHLSINVMWTSTASNPADFPSRNRPIPSPVINPSHDVHVPQPGERSDRTVCWIDQTAPPPTKLHTVSDVSSLLAEKTPPTGTRTVSHSLPKAPRLGVAHPEPAKVWWPPFPPLAGELLYLEVH